MALTEQQKEIALREAKEIPEFLWSENCGYESGVIEPQVIDFASRFLAARAGKPECKWLHAEVLAILRARGKPIYRITIERYDNEGFPALAAPCIICREAIKIFNIQIVEYTK